MQLIVGVLHKQDIPEAVWRLLSLHISRCVYTKSQHIHGFVSIMTNVWYVNCVVHVVVYLQTPFCEQSKINISKYIT